LALQLIADTHAAVAIDASSHVHANIGIRLIKEFGRVAAEAFSFEVISTDQAVELFVRKLGQALGGILLNKQSEQ
jgi:hypothetical protein